MKKKQSAATSATTGGIVVRGPQRPDLEADLLAHIVILIGRELANRTAAAAADEQTPPLPEDVA